MAAELTVDDAIAIVRDEHGPWPAFTDRNWCGKCEAPMPCAELILCDEIERLRAQTCKFNHSQFLNQQEADLNAIRTLANERDRARFGVEVHQRMQRYCQEHFDGSTEEEKAQFREIAKRLAGDVFGITTGMN